MEERAAPRAAAAAAAAAAWGRRLDVNDNFGRTRDALVRHGLTRRPRVAREPSGGCRARRRPRSLSARAQTRNTGSKFASALDREKVVGKRTRTRPRICCSRDRR